MIPQPDDSLTAAPRRRWWHLAPVEVIALPAFRAYDARLYHLAPDPQAGSVKREE